MPVDVQHEIPLSGSALAMNCGLLAFQAKLFNAIELRAIAVSFLPVLAGDHTPFHVCQ